MTHFRNLIVCSALGGDTGSLEATPDQIKTLTRQAKLCDVSRLYRVADELAAMEDKLRNVLGVRTLIEMSLLRASRIATVASIEELMRAVRALAERAAQGAPLRTSAPVPAAAPAPSDPVSASAAVPATPATPAAPATPVTPAAPAAKAPAARRGAVDREKCAQILDDPKLNDLCAALNGKVVDISQKL